MQGEFRIEVEAVERGEPGEGRVRLRVSKPEGLESFALEKQLLGFYAKELGSRVALRVRRAPWGDGIRVEGTDAVVARGLDPQGQVQLDSHARAAAEECTRDLQPDGKMGSRVHEILRRLGPRG
jgi:hypothetical protein